MRKNKLSSSIGYILKHRALCQKASDGYTEQELKIAEPFYNKQKEQAESQPA